MSRDALNTFQSFNICWMFEVKQSRSHLCAKLNEFYQCDVTVKYNKKCVVVIIKHWFKFVYDESWTGLKHLCLFSLEWRHHVGFKHKTDQNCFCVFQSIVRGSFIGHEDYISAAIAQLSRLSVSSSNSLRRSSPSLRKRAQSLGRLTELTEGETYEYQGLNEAKHTNGKHATDWRTTSRQVHSESGSPRVGSKSYTFEPNDNRPRAKSIHEASILLEETALMPRDILLLPRAARERPVVSRTGGRNSERPVSCLYTSYSVDDESNKPSASARGSTPARPHSAYNFKVFLLVWIIFMFLINIVSH